MWNGEVGNGFINGLVGEDMPDVILNAGESV